MKAKYTLLWVIIFSLWCFNSSAQTKAVTLDYFFNHEYKKNAKGEMERYHYTWEDTAQSGYSKFGAVFRRHGFRLKSLDMAPTKENLAGTSVYLIVDPDTKAETPKPNFIQPQDIKTIGDWVNSGGVLVVMANDSANVEFEHLNHLTETFGIHLNGDSKSKVFNNQYDMAAFLIPKNDPVFITAHKVYLKEVSSLKLYGSAKPILIHQKKKYIVAAIAKYGKGTVLVIGDPWFYNEYLNGRLPSGWDNDKAANDLVKWLSKQVANGADNATVYYSNTKHHKAV
jgi:unsaturated rhamnogalacturonyl hydrolase